MPRPVVFRRRFRVVIVPVLLDRDRKGPRARAAAASIRGHLQRPGIPKAAGVPARHEAWLSPPVMCPFVPTAKPAGLGTRSTDGISLHPRVAVDRESEDACVFPHSSHWREVTKPARSRSGRAEA